MADWERPGMAEQVVKRVAIGSYVRISNPSPNILWGS